MKRQCYYINPTQDPVEHGGYVPSLVIEAAEEIIKSINDYLDEASSDHATRLDMEIGVPIICKIIDSHTAPTPKADRLDLEKIRGRLMDNAMEPALFDALESAYAQLDVQGGIVCEMISMDLSKDGPYLTLQAPSGTRWSAGNYTVTPQATLAKHKDTK